MSDARAVWDLFEGWGIQLIQAVPCLMKEMGRSTNQQSMETQISSIQQHLNIFLGYNFFRTWTDGYSYQGQLKNSKGEFPWSCSMTSGNVEFPLFWTFTQHRRANSRTNLARWTQCSDDLVVGIAAWDAFAGETSGAACKGVGSCWGVQELQQEPHGWTCCRLFEQSLSKLQPREMVSSSGHVSM